MKTNSEDAMSETIVPENIDIIEILKLLPHRYPFVMVDKILSVEIGKEVIGLKNVTFNEQFFQGHFPGQPVMPGVLMLEGLAQVGCVHAFLAEPDAVGNKIAFFAGIDKARFRKQVVPGDQLIYKVQLVKQKRSLIMMNAQGFVDDEIVVEAELKAMFG